MPTGPTCCGRIAFSVAELWRMHLLLLLTSAQSLNLVAAQLHEHAACQGFCRLGSLPHLPDGRMFHKFRQQQGPADDDALLNMC